MWWLEVQSIDERLSALRSAQTCGISLDAVIEDGAVIDESAGPVMVGPGTRICAGAIVKGPIAIGSDCLVGNLALLRGPVLIGNQVRIGYSSEVKQALVADHASIGPMCFIADSKIEEAAYLGAMVRTSNHRLDGLPITVIDSGKPVSTGCEKLGCLIGARAALGIQVIVLPGRVIAADSVFEPRVTVSRNLPQGHYRIRQEVECLSVNCLEHEG